MARNKDKTATPETTETPDIAPDATNGGTATATEGDTAQIEGATPDANRPTDPNWPGRYAEYKLAGAVPEALKGKTIRTKESRNLDEMHLLTDGGKPENVNRLAQAQYDIIVQRKIRDEADSEEVKAILAGKPEVEIDGEKLDFSGMSEEDRVDYALDRIQRVAFEYVYGARPALGSGGKGAAAKKAVATVEDLKQKAAADPELAAKLAALGITL